MEIPKKGFRESVYWSRTSKLQLYTIGVICVGFFICLFLPYHDCTYAFVFYALCGSVSVVCICIRCQYCTNITRCFCNLSLGFCDLVLYLPLSFLSIFYRCICVLCLCLVFCVLCLCSVFCVLCGSKYASLFLANVVFLCFCALCSVFCGLSSVRNSSQRQK